LTKNSSGLSSFLDKNAYTADATQTLFGIRMGNRSKISKSLAMAVALTLFSAVLGIQLMGLAIANPVYIESWTDSPNISLNSPLNKTYSENVLLNFTVTASESWLSYPVSFDYESGSGLAQELLSVDYYVDGDFCGSIVANSHLSSPFQYSVYLTNLKDGNHSLMVCTNSTGVERDWISDKVYNVPANSSSVTVHFTLETAPSNSVLPLPEPFLTTLLIVVALLVVIIGTGLLAYFKKRKRYAETRSVKKS
jgi:hypothetical protein